MAERIQGLADLTAKLNGFQQRAKEAAGRELYQFGEEVMEVSKNERVPVDTGALMNTGKVMPPEGDGDLTTVQLGYGDESAPYAVAVHENLDPKVHWSRPGSGPKYLEAPLKETQDTLAPRVGKAVKDELLS